MADSANTTNPSLFNRRTLMKWAAVVPFSYGVSKAMQHADAYLIDLGEQLSVAWKRENEVNASEPLDDEFEAAYAATHDIVRKIEAEKATTIEGLKVKARAVSWCHGGDPFVSAVGDGTTDVRLAGSILKELIELS